MYEEDLPDAPVITAADPAEFPYSVFHGRHPKVFAQVRSCLPYGPAELAALDALEHESLHGTLERPAVDDAGDQAAWDKWGTPYFGRSLPWTHAPFLWSESYFHRRLLSATGYFAGRWAGVDPFGPMKAASLVSPALEAELRGLDSLAERAPDERDAALLHASLWGNTADLGFQLVAGTPVSPEVLVDDGPALWSHLDARPGPVILFADNAAEELVYDLLLAEHMLTTGRATRMTVYLKPRPYYVSDATMQDAALALGRLARIPGYPADAAARLREYAAAGRLTWEAPAFLCAPLDFRSLPDEIAGKVATASLTVFKGDLNYRRLVGDRLWPAAQSFRSLTSYLRGPVAALRTCKSDVAIGLDERVVAGLDASEPGWRFAGRHAVIQFGG